MKTELLIFILGVTVSASAAAVVPAEDVLPEKRAEVSVPVVPVEDVPEERTDASAPAVAEEGEAELVPEDEGVQDQRAELSVPDQTASGAQVDPLKDSPPRDGGPPPFIRERSSSQCPRGWHTYQDSCYLLVNLTYSWTNAEFLCESLGASLASAHSLWEYSFLKQLTWKAGFLTAWIGGYRFQGYWKWDDGTPFDYNNWYSQRSTSGYDCIYLNSQDSLGWTGERCHLSHPFICSFKLTYC